MPRCIVQLAPIHFHGDTVTPNEVTPTLGSFFTAPVPGWHGREVWIRPITSSWAGWGSSRSLAGPAQPHLQKHPICFHPHFWESSRDFHNGGGPLMEELRDGTFLLHPNPSSGVNWGLRLPFWVLLKICGLTFQFQLTEICMSFTRKILCGNLEQGNKLRLF